MSNVDQFPRIPSLTGESRVPVARRSDAESPTNYIATLNQFAQWLETQGFARNLAEVPVRFYTDFADLPVGGIAQTLFLVTGEGRGLYFWDGSNYMSFFDQSSGGGLSVSGSYDSDAAALAAGLSVGDAYAVSAGNEQGIPAGVVKIIQ